MGDRLVTPAIALGSTAVPAVRKVARGTLLRRRIVAARPESADPSVRILAPVLEAWVGPIEGLPIARVIGGQPLRWPPSRIRAERRTDAGCGAVYSHVIKERMGAGAMRRFSRRRHPAS